MEIQLTRGYVATVDDCDDDLALLKWTAFVHPKRDSNPYAYRMVRGGEKQRQVRLHQVVMERIVGRSLLPGELPDHKDGNPLNNCRDNLRIATNSQNRANSKLDKRNTSGYKGVSWLKSHKKWRATIGFNGERIFIGLFNTAENAAKAYKDKAIELFGEFARME